MKTNPMNSFDYKTISFETPLGIMTAMSEREGLFALDFNDSPNLDSVLQSLRDASEVGIDDHLVLVKKQIDEYFSGIRKEFTVRLSLHGTDFQKKVWTELMKIPYGNTRTYTKQAMALNYIKAIRAVASANGKNKIAIIVPCHRVIGSDGSLTGYAGGLWRKKWLLEFENNIKTPGLFS